MTTITKKTTLLAGPIAQSTDGKVKVYSVADEDGAVTPGFLSPHVGLFIKGTGLKICGEGTSIGISTDVRSHIYSEGTHSMAAIGAEEVGNDLRIEFGSSSGLMKNGSYTDASIELRYYATGEEASPEIIDIPVAYTVTQGGDEWLDE